MMISPKMFAPDAIPFDQVMAAIPPGKSSSSFKHSKCNQSPPLGMGGKAKTAIRCTGGGKAPRASTQALGAPWPSILFIWNSAVATR
jgi:hypothetical protein